MIRPYLTILKPEQYDDVLNIPFMIIGGYFYDEPVKRFDNARTMLTGVDTINGSQYLDEICNIDETQIMDFLLLKCQIDNRLLRNNVTLANLIYAGNYDYIIILQFPQNA